MNKKIRKRIIELTIVLVALSFMAGCGSKAPTDTTHLERGSVSVIRGEIFNNCLENNDTQGAKDVLDTYLYLMAFCCQPYTEITYDDMLNRRYENVDLGEKVKEIMATVSFASMWNMDGMILLGFCADEYQLLRDRIRIPFVVYDGFFENDRNICNLMLDDHDGGKQVGKYLRGHNCLNVLFMADNRLSPDLDRYKGLCDGLGRKADFWEIPMYKEERIIYYTCRVKEFAGYGAVFAASDYYAIELLYFLMDNGYKVPDDIWIIGFDDITECVNVRPTLASVRQDVSYRARKAVEYLTCMKKDNDCSVTEKISVEFIPRDSCIQQPELSTVRNR